MSLQAYIFRLQSMSHPCGPSAVDGMGWMDDDGMLRHGKTSQGKFAGVRARAMGGHRAKKEEESTGSDDAKRTPILCPPSLQFSVGRRQTIWHFTSRSSGRTGDATSRMLLARPLAQNWRASEHRTPGGASPPSPSKKNGPKIVSLMISHAKPSLRRKYNACQPPVNEREWHIPHSKLPSPFFLCANRPWRRGGDHTDLEAGTVGCMGPRPSVHPTPPHRDAHADSTVSPLRPPPRTLSPMDGVRIYVCPLFLMTASFLMAAWHTQLKAAAGFPMYCSSFFLWSAQPGSATALLLRRSAA